ncbi:MAG: O-antigen ligase family protein [Burkholderiales bacterium]|nr:O-antigen ligase family protein [Nitrosomonas sp.]MCP5274307.1 O-antigen ligase family protein [Burkholderiales bacterium]
MIVFCAGLWFSVLYKFIVVFLILAWLIDDRAPSFGSIIKEPLVQAIFVLCTVLLLGLLWSDASLEGRHKWTKYFLLLVYVPFFALMNKQRLPWAIGAVLAGYCMVLFAGLHVWMVEEELGIPVFNMTYLTFSAMLGVGSVLSCCWACMSRNKTVQTCLAVLALVLLYLQFHQGARGFLLATVLTQLALIVIYFRVTLYALAGIAIMLLLVTIFFANTNPVAQQRWMQAGLDFEKMQQGDFSSSVGYRFGFWDVGFHGIAEKPLVGHGTGMPERYFEQTITQYKGGIYKDLPKFHPTSHYHNDWIEIGMQLGALGVMALLFLFWAWFQAFKRSGLVLLGIGIMSFIGLSGLTETFMIFGRIPVLLLVITAIIICWQREVSDVVRYTGTASTPD